MPEKSSSGVFRSLRRLLADLIETGRTRLALLANEAEEAKLRLVGVMACALLALETFMIGMVLLAFFFTLLFWENRLLTLGVFCGVFFALTATLILIGRSLWKQCSSLFSASLEELRADVEHLRAGKPDHSE